MTGLRTHMQNENKNSWLMISFLILFPPCPELLHT